ncbi:hypothetical protein POG22_04850 [Geitlerinema sp. CS-897]|nr:hypothetical protein [Geitlerinema sp. CS-897]
MTYPTQEDDRPIVVTYESEILKTLQKTVSQNCSSQRETCCSWWLSLLVTVASLSCLVSPHVPIVAFSAIASRTLPLKTVVSSLVGLWAIDRFYDVFVRHSSIDLEWWIWGGVAGLTGLAIAGFSLWIAPSENCKIRDRYLGIWTSFFSGFLFFQAFLMLVNGEMKLDFLTLDVLNEIFVREILWAIVFSGLHYLLIEIVLPEIGKCFVGNLTSTTDALSFEYKRSHFRSKQI